MKNLIIIACLLVSTNSIYSQCCNQPNSINYLISGGGEDYGGYNFQFYGDETDSFLKSMLNEFPESKRKNYTWKFKNVKIEGIDGLVSFELHKGLKGDGENGSSYFNTFKNEKSKTFLLSTKTESEMTGIVIYVRNGRKNALKTEEQAQIVKDYLLSIKE